MNTRADVCRPTLLLVAGSFKACLQPRFFAILLALGAISGCSSTPDKPTGRADLAPCGWLPNCVNSASGHGLQAVEPIKANHAQWQRVKTWIAGQPHWEIVTDDSDFIQVIVKTPLMRFRDDVQLQFDPDSELIQVRSSSRLGISDLGTNYRRVEALRAVLDSAAAGVRTSGTKTRSKVND
jgi:uncharacterized protein (DUF1499 family)